MKSQRKKARPTSDTMTSAGRDECQSRIRTQHLSMISYRLQTSLLQPLNAFLLFQAKGRNTACALAALLKAIGNEFELSFLGVQAMAVLNIHHEHVVGMRKGKA